jgi:hypothetical protein
MTENTWEMIVEPEKPMPVSELETTVKEGEGLNFPIKRSYEMNLVNSYWDEFVTDMAMRHKNDILTALQKGDTKGFQRIMERVASISSMYRLNNASLKGKKLEAEFGITNFKDYIGTTQHALIDPQFRQMLMDAGIEDANNPNHYFSNPVATCANIVTCDRFVPMGMRSNKVAIYPGVPSVIGGYVKVNGDNNPDFSTRDVDLFSNMKKELSEEIGLNKEDMISTDFLGVIRNKATRGPEAVYNVSLNIASDELYKRWNSKSKDKFEHRNITFHPVKELPRFIEEWKGRMSPTGEATLTLFLKHYNA